MIWYDINIFTYIYTHYNSTIFVLATVVGLIAFKLCFLGQKRCCCFGRPAFPTDPKALPRVAQQSEPRNPGSKYEDSRGLESIAIFDPSFLLFAGDQHYASWHFSCHLLLRDARRHLVPISFYLVWIIFQELFHWMHFQLTVLGRSSNKNPFEIGESWDKLNHQLAVSANQSIMVDFRYHNKQRHYFRKKGRVKKTHWEILQLQHIFHKNPTKQDTTATNHELTTLWWLTTHCLASSTQELIYVFRAKLTTSSHSIPNQVHLECDFPKMVLEWQTLLKHGGF